jgi:hypothetical protein
MIMMMSKKQITVQTHATYMDRIDEVAKQIKNAGMTVQDELLSIGHFAGVADAATIAQLKKIPGVASVKVIGDEGSTQPDEYTINK